MNVALTFTDRYTHPARARRGRSPRTGAPPGALDPVFTPGGIFNAPGTGVSVTGKRPGRAAGLTRWADLRERLDRARDGSVTTPSFTIGHGAGQAVTAVVVELDWKSDGKAPVRYAFTTSPKV
ncbi:hypothetical protein ACFWHQ_32465 [Streptomyces sp. NPDC060334]|uniref:hypothetical protein n=1 Tax=Streptomyces sp. NPDC060334 TaxID=3347099 RepID=UPI003652EDF2